MSERVPEGWKNLLVKEAFEIGRGRVISKDEIRDNFGSYPVFSSQSTNKGKMGSIRTFDFEGEYITWTTDGAYAGTVFYRTGKFNCTNVCGTLRDTGTFQIDMRFVSEYLSTVAKNHVSYVGNPKLMNGIFGAIEFLLPPLPEQKKIASILTSVDEAIEKTQSQINKLQDLKKATINELLTKGIGHKEFKDSEFGQIPENWEINELNDCLEIMTDFVANGSFQSLRENVNVKDKVDYALYVRLFDIRKGIIHQSQKYVDKNSYNFLKKSSLHGDEILIANIGAYVGQVHLMPKINEPATLAPNMILLRVLKKYHYKFLYYFLSSDLGQKIIFLSVAGSGQEKLNKTDLKKIKIVLPTMDEQVKISEIISRIEQKIILINKKFSKYILIKKSLMQVLLTGKVKVKVN